MAKNKNKKTNQPTDSLKLLLFLSLLLSVVILPLITNKDALDISLMPRLLVLTVFLIGMTWVLSSNKAFTKLDTSLLRKPLFAIYAAYFVTGLVSLFYAFNITAGYFDTAKTFVILVFMVYAGLLFVSVKEWKRLLAIAVVVASVLTLAVGFYEYVDKLGFGFHSRNAMTRIKGLMSNVNLYANSLLLMVPLVGFGVFTLTKGWKKIALVTLASLLLMIFLLQTRAAYVGLVAGLLCVLAVLILFNKNFGISSKFRNSIILVSLLLASLSALAVATAKPDNPYANRIKSIFDNSNDGGRTLIWTITGKMIADHPLTGVGAGNFMINIQEYYGEFDFGSRETNWLRPHNDFLWVLSEKGVFGLALFLLFFGLGLYYAIAIIRSDTSRENKLFALFSIMGITSYMVNSFFDFPLERINQQVYLALYVSGTTAIYHQVKSGSKPLSLKNKTFIAIILTIALTLVSIFSYKALRQEIYMQNTIGFHRSERWEEMLVAAQNARTSWKTLNPLATPVAYYEGTALARLNDIPNAIKAFEQAVQHNPNRKYILNNLANALLLAKENEKAAYYAEKSLQIFPRDEETLRILATAYFYESKFTEALETLERIPEKDLTPEVRSNIRHLQQLTRESNAQPSEN